MLGLQANWSIEAAKLAGQLGARLREMKFPTPERTEQFARDVWNETVRLTGRAILDTALGVKLADDQLVDAVCRGQTLLGLATISLKPSVPVVAVDFGYTDQSQDILEMTRDNGAGGKVKVSTFNLKLTTTGAGTLPAVIERAVIL